MAQESLLLQPGYYIQAMTPRRIEFLAYWTGVPLLRHVAAVPSEAERIAPDWSAQNARRP